MNIAYYWYFIKEKKKRGTLSFDSLDRPFVAHGFRILTPPLLQEIHTRRWLEMTEASDGRSFPLSGPCLDWMSRLRLRPVISSPLAAAKPLRNSRTYPEFFRKLLLFLKKVPFY
ncbi:hypothetical protein TNIN_339801 [Trichonephila inaurata madagascariensis]|uniref:Uncharacterized protein n=1 Tax=Trichonephila inaurata madagascariensis TaxID=2747483 RepID=A0A8X6YNF3_9ARAC|nr:hypothetical protein TNIN_339801 [Trichonephila inaurata madagascariensis]